MVMRPMIVRPSQYALKLPATRPERMFSDAPPSRDEVTTSFTCAECVEVKTLTNSGMIAPARVPQVITVDSCHHRSVLPPSEGINRSDSTYVSTTETIEVSHTSVVNGASKFIFAALAYFALAMALLTRYEPADASTIITRIMKIQTSSWTCVDGSLTASRMNEISATP